jgi:membrane-bound lytic murein transglycosylase A
LPPRPAPAPIPDAGTARASGVVAGPLVSSLPFGREQASIALQAFRTSCPALLKRNDASGLTRPQDWQPACIAADSADGDAAGFFARWFETAQVGGGSAFATGYYEPEIAGSRVRAPGYDTPVYRRPTDLIQVDLGAFSDSLQGKKISGRLTGTTLVPYFDRTEIESGALAGKGLEIAWAADPVEFFFLQVQGSGRLRLPDGTVMRIGYDSQNGRDYTGIGALMRQRGLIGPDQASMQGIVQWLHDHPDQGRYIMRENKSWVFFRELTGPGPIGALGVPVAPRATVAADPKFVPLGAPVWLSLDRREGTGIWIAQDTGGAIKGANRFDTFWGAGDEARAVAGGMSGRGTAFLLLPVGTLARLQSESAYGGPSARR